MEDIKKWIKKPWPYWLGGILLGVINVVLLWTTGTSWHITSGFLLWSVGILQWMGLEPLKWEYFTYLQHNYQTIIENNNLFINRYTILNMGTVLGALIATLLASQFKWKKIKNRKQLLFALLGGIMMGYGTRLAFGCTVGSFFSGIPSFSLHPWIFGIFITLGAWVGVKIIVKFLA